MQRSQDCSLLAGFPRSVLTASRLHAPGFARAPGPTAARALARQPLVLYTSYVTNNRERSGLVLVTEETTPTANVSIRLRREPDACSLDLTQTWRIGPCSPRHKLNLPSSICALRRLSIADHYLKGTNRYRRGSAVPGQTCSTLVYGKIMSADSSVEAPCLLTLKQASSRLGLCRRSLERLIAAKEFPPVVKVGPKNRSSRILASDVTAYIEAHAAKREVAS